MKRKSKAGRSVGDPHPPGSSPANAAGQRVEPSSKKGRELLAKALRALKKLQDKHHGVVETGSLAEGHRAVLLEAGFLRPVIKGWYIVGDPGARDGDSTAWFATFWAFVSGYLGWRFGKRYCLNPEASLLLGTGSTTVPRQVVAVTLDGGTSILKLPFDTSLMLYPDENRVPRSRTEVRGLQVWPVAEALCLVGPQFFIAHPREAEIALALIRDPSELLTTLLAGDGMRSAAARLAGALQFVGRADEAGRILRAFAQSGHALRPVNPFVLSEPTLLPGRERSPYVLRLRSMWASWRQTVIDHFPAPPGLDPDAETYLAQVEERYQVDAYNSLSIEGYQVTDGLIARVAGGNWNPEASPDDKKDRDVLAARGYYLAFNSVKKSIAAVCKGENAGRVVQRDHHHWYSELFRPAVIAGILERNQLVGYRNGPVFIRNSMHTPVPREAVLDTLEVLWELLREEPHAGVRAVLGHHLFVFIHPYFDGNGRIGRFLMNALLASGGYPWTVIRMKRRREYMAALERASVHGDIIPLTGFIAAEMKGGSSESEEARQIFRSAPTEKPKPPVDLAARVRSRVAAIGGAEPHIEPREPIRPPPDFGTGQERTRSAASKRKPGGRTRK